MAGETSRICKRCRKGPSLHGGHERGDPECILHGFQGTSRKEIADFLKQKQIDEAVRQALRASPAGPATQVAEGSAPDFRCATTTTSGPSTTLSPPLPPPPRPPEAILQSKHRRKHKKAKEGPTKASSDPEDGANAFIDDPIHELPDTRGQTGKAAPRSPLGRTPVRAFASPPAALTPPVIHTTSKGKPPEPSKSSPTKASVEPEDENNAFIDDPLYDLFGILGPTGKAAPRSPIRRTPVRAFASPPAALIPPSPYTTSKGKPSEPSQSSRPCPSSTSTSLRSTDIVERKQEPGYKVEPEWTLPPTKSRTSGVIRGLSPIEAGAARAIPASDRDPPHQRCSVYSTEDRANTLPDRGETPKVLEHRDSVPDSRDLRHDVATATKETYCILSEGGNPGPTSHAGDGEPGGDHTAGAIPDVAYPPDELQKATEVSLKGRPPDHVGTFENEACEKGISRHHYNLELPTSTGETPEASQAPRQLPAHDDTSLLEPLPPGWVQTQHSSEGLHPSEDVFEDLTRDADDLVDKPAFEQGDPEHMLEEYEDFEDSDAETGEDPKACDNREAVPEPAGLPSRLTAQQKARLLELLQTRDQDGKVPFGLDQYNDDESMWRAYRSGIYRAQRKRKRADGTWDKDDHRGWGQPIARSGSAGPPGDREPPRRERSPLPRRRSSSWS